MKIFLIIVAVIVVIIAIILSLSATVTLVYDKGWSTKLNVLFIEKEISLSQILSFVLFPEKKADEVSDNKKNKKKEKAKGEKSDATPAQPQSDISDITDVGKQTQAADASQNKIEEKQNDAPQKSNPIKKIWDNEGIVGILSLISNLAETANSAIITLIKGLHIYSLYVMIIVGGGDAAQIANSYGRICSFYYPVKGLILSSMKVDNYDDYIQPDFIAPCNEYEFQLIASINVGLLLKVVLKAGFIFIKNLIKNKKGD